MKSSAPWTVTVAAAALLVLPCAVSAQTPPAPQPAPATQPSTPAADAAQATPASQGSAQEHLKQAKSTLEDIGTANLPARARTQVAELKKRITTLERMAAAGNTGAVAATQTPSETNTKTRVSRTTASWGNEVAAMDKIVTTLLGVSPTGTTGTTSAKPPAAATLDDATRTKLTEFRTHLTAFATAMATQTPTAGDTPAPKAEPSAPTPATEPAQQPPAPTPTPQQPPTQTPPPSAAPATEPAAPAAQKVDEEAAKRHLTEARNTLSQLTQLPEAGKLTGDVRTHVTQLITNFNELITTQSNWQAAYAKVSANLTALLGPEAGAAASGTEGAVGTAGGGMTLDPAVRQKLVEMRKNLVAFERASGGGAAAGSSPASDPPAAATKPTEPTRPATEPATPPPTEPATPPAAATGPQSPAVTATDALTHVAAIEALLKSQNEGGGLTLDKAQVELLRTHIAELRKLLEKK